MWVDAMNIHNTVSAKKKESLSTLPSATKRVMATKKILLAVSTSVALIIWGGTTLAYYMKPAPKKAVIIPPEAKESPAESIELLMFIQKSKKIRIHTLEWGKEELMVIDPSKETKTPLVTTKNTTTQESEKLPADIETEKPAINKKGEKTSKDPKPPIVETPIVSIIQDNGDVVYDGSPESTRQLSELLKQFSIATGGSKK